MYFGIARLGGGGVNTCPDGLLNFFSRPMSCFLFLTSWFVSDEKNKRARAPFRKPQNSDQLFQYLRKIGRCDMMNLEYDTSEQTLVFGLKSLQWINNI